MELEKGVCVNIIKEPARPNYPSLQGHTAHRLVLLRGQSCCPRAALPRASVCRAKPWEERGFVASFMLTKDFQCCQTTASSPFPSLPQPLGLPLAGPEGCTWTPSLWRLPFELEKHGSRMLHCSRVLPAEPIERPGVDSVPQTRKPGSGLTHKACYVWLQRPAPLGFSMPVN